MMLLEAIPVLATWQDHTIHNDVHRQSSLCVHLVGARISQLSDPLSNSSPIQSSLNLSKTARRPREPNPGEFLDCIFIIWESLTHT